MVGQIKTLSRAAWAFIHDLGINTLPPDRDSDVASTERIAIALRTHHASGKGDHVRGIAITGPAASANTRTGIVVSDVA